MVVFGQKDCIPEKVAVFEQKGFNWAKWFYSNKNGSTREKVVVFRQNNCVPAKVVVFLQNGFIRVSVVVFGQKWLYMGKVSIF